MKKIIDKYEKNSILDGFIYYDRVWDLIWIIILVIFLKI